MPAGKNKHRLSRTLRKVTKKVAPRPWHAQDYQAPAAVTKAAVFELINGLTEEELKQAMAEQDPPSTEEVVLASRQAKFGVATAGAPASDDAALAARAAKFGTIPSSAPNLFVDAETEKKRAAKFGVLSNPTVGPAVVTLSEDVAAKRAAKFGSIS